MVFWPGFPMLLLLFAWQSKALPSCVYNEDITATRLTEITTASDCLFSTIMVSDSTSGRKIAAMMKSGNLGPRGMCRVLSNGDLIAEFLTDGSNNGIVSQPNNAASASMLLTCFQDVSQAISFSFYSVDTVSDVEEIMNIQLSHIITVTSYQPNTLYQWSIIAHADDALASVWFISNNTHADDVLLVYSDNAQHPKQILPSQEGSQYHIGLSLHIQLLTSDSATNANSITFGTDYFCMEESFGVMDWFLSFDAFCPSLQRLVTFETSLSYLILFPTRQVPSITCYIYQGNTTEILLGTLEGNQYSGDVVTGTSDQVFIDCSTPESFFGEVRIFIREYDTSCGSDITLEQNVYQTLDLPTTVNGYLPALYCEWRVQSTSYLNAAQLLAPEFGVIGKSFFQITDQYLVDTLMLAGQFVFLDTTLVSETASVVRFYADSEIANLEPFDIAITASCSMFCLSEHSGTENEIFLEWTSPEVVQQSTYTSVPGGAFWYSNEPEGCLAHLPINTWQNVTVTAMGGVTSGCFEHRLSTKPGKMDTPFLISTTTISANIGWPRYTEGDVFIDTYYVNWNGDIGSGFGLSSIIDALEPNSMQSVTVQAVNTAGVGRESDQLLFVTEPTAFFNIRLLSCPTTTSIVVDYTGVINDGVVRSLVYGEICWCYSLDDIKTDNLTAAPHTLTDLLPGRRVVVFTKAIYDDGFVARSENTVLQPVPLALSNAPILVGVEMEKITIAWEPYNEPGDIVPDEYVIFWTNGVTNNSITVSARTTNFTFMLVNLVPNTNYQLSVAVKTENCLSSMSPVLSVNTLPGPARNLEQSDFDERNTTIGWAPPLGGTARAITNYIVEWTLGLQQENVSVDGSTLMAVITGLTPNTAYLFTVITVYSDGYETQTEPFRAGTRPPPPHSLVVSTTKTSLTVSYSQDAIGNLPVTFGYSVNPGTPPVIVAGLSFQILNLIPNAFISFTLEAQNEFGNSSSISGSGVTLPPAPVITSIIPSPNGLDVTWMLPTHGSHRSFDFEVIYDQISAPMGVQSISSSPLNAQITSLESNTYYWVQIKANFDDGLETRSENSTKLTSPSMSFAAPILVSTTQNSLTVQWNAPSGDGALLYTLYVQTDVIVADIDALQASITGLSSNTLISNIYVVVKNEVGQTTGASASFATDPGPPTSPAVSAHTPNSFTVSWSPPDGNAYSVAGYRITFDGQTITQSSNSYAASGLSPGTSYTLVITAMFNSVPETSVSIAGCTNPGPPTNLIQVAENARSIGLQWQDPPSCSDILFIAVGQINANNNPFTLTGLSPNTVYTIEVAAVTDTGRGETASQIMNTVPDSPSVGISQKSFIQVRISINTGGPANGAYIFQHYLLTGVGLSNETVTATDYTFTGLEPTTSYGVTVKAVYQNLSFQPTLNFAIHTDPKSVQNLGYIINSISTATVTWDKPEGGNDIKFYEVQLSGEPIPDTTNSLHYGLRGLVPNTEYTVSVFTVNYDNIKATARHVTVRSDAKPTTQFLYDICLPTFVMVSWVIPINQGNYRPSIYGYEVCDGSSSCVETTSSTYNFTMSPATTISVGLTTIYNLGSGETEMFTVTSVVAVTSNAEVPPNLNVMELFSYESVVVQWDASVGGPNITDYVVEYNTATTSNTLYTTPFVLAVNITGLLSNTKYNISVAAATVCGQGAASLFHYVTAQEPVTEITQSMVTTTSTQITITVPRQDGNFRTFDSFEISRNGVSQGSFSSAVVDLTGMVSNTEYSLLITSKFVDSTGVFPDSFVTSTTLFIRTIPSVPQTLVLSNPSTDMFDASWTKPAGGDAIVDYNVECDTDDTFQSSFSLSTTSLSATVMSLNSNTEYYCRIIAINEQGASDPSTTDSILTDPNSPDITFEYSTTDTITVSLGHETGGGARRFQSYEVKVSDTTGLYPPVSASSSPIAVTGLPSATKFDVTATAMFNTFVTESGISEMYTVSNSVDVNTGSSTQTSITVTWLAPLNNGTELDGYEVQLNSSSAGPFQDVGNVLQTTINGLEANTHYLVAVFAYNLGGRSDTGEVFDIWTEPFDPQIYWNASTTDTITIFYTWNDNNGFEGYSALEHKIFATSEDGVTVETSLVPAGNNPLDVSGLIAGSRYEVQQQLRLQNTAGFLTVMSNLINVVTVPDIPRNLQVVEELETSVSLSWDPPSVGLAISEYIIVLSAQTIVEIGLASKIVVVNATSVVITGIAPNTVFAVAVHAQNRAGTSVPVTTEATTSPSPSGPPETIAAFAESLLIVWDHPPNYARNATFKLVVFDAFGAEEFSFDPATSPTEVSSLLSSTVYHMLITSTFPDNFILDSPTSRHLTVPSQPAQMILDCVSADSMTVNYTEISGGFPCCEITFYEILVQTNTTNETVVTLSPPPAPYTFPVLPNSHYRLSVRAVNSQGPGIFSQALAVVSKPGPTGPPSIISSSTDTVSFEWNPLVEGDFVITNYLVSISPFSVSDGAMFVAGTSATFTMLEANRRYTVAVQAEGIGGLGEINRNFVTNVHTAPDNPPTPVSSPTSPPTASEITIEWSCASFRGCLEITRYEISWVQSGGNQSDNGSEIISTNPDSCEFSYHISGLLVNTLYNITVAAGNAYAIGPSSDPVEICTNPAVPDPPMVQFHHHQQAIIVDWSPPIVGGGVAIIKYKIAWTSSTDNGHKLVTVSDSNHTAAITGLLPVTTYQVTVQAINDHGIGSASSFGTVTTGSGIICNEQPTIRLTSEDVATMNPVNGDQIVVSSMKIKHQPAANRLMTQCKIPAMPGSGAEFHFNLSDCQPLVAYDSDKFDGVDNTTLRYTYTVQLARFSVLNNPVQRFNPTTCFEFQCIFNRSSSVTSGNVHPYIFKDLVVMDPEHGQFDLSLDLFTSNGYNTLLTGSPPTVEVFTFIYAQLRLGVDANNVILQAQHCWATPSHSPDDLVSYPIIVDSCPANNAFDESGTILVTRNYQPNIAQFQFKAFVWSHLPDRNQTIFIHCNIMVCDPRSQDDCTDLTCDSSRKRRNLPIADNSQSVTYGPIMLGYEEKDLCAEANGGCEDLCMVENESIKCMCKAGRKLNDDGYTCSVKYYNREKIQSIQQAVLLFLIAGILLALVGHSLHK